MIDAHLHLSRSKDDALIAYARRNGLRYNLGELLGLMRRHGVVRGLLITPPLVSGRPLPNEAVLKLCGESRGKLSPVLTAMPARREVDTVISLAKENRERVKGFKILLGYVRVFANSKSFEPLYRYAEKEGIPVMFHTGDTADSGGSLIHSHPLTLDALANAHPDMKVVACHFGNPWIEDVGELIYKHRNLYADISGLAVGDGGYSVRYSDWLARKISDAIYFAGGADKVIFGTDYPVTSHSAALALADKLEIEASDREKILYRNARSVFSF